MKAQSIMLNAQTPVPRSIDNVHAGLVDRSGRKYALWYPDAPPADEMAALQTRHERLLESIIPTNIVVGLVRGDGLDAQIRAARLYALEHGAGCRIVVDRTTARQLYRRELGSVFDHARDGETLIGDSGGCVVVFVSSLERLSPSPAHLQKIIGHLSDLGIALVIGNLDNVVVQREPNEPLLPLDWITRLLRASEAEGIYDVLPRPMFVEGVA